MPDKDAIIKPAVSVSCALDTQALFPPGATLPRKHGEEWRRRMAHKPYISGFAGFFCLRGYGMICR